MNDSRVPDGRYILAATDIMRHSSVTLRPDPARTVIRPFSPADPMGFIVPGHPRIERITDRLLALDESWLQLGRQRASALLAERHRNMEGVLLRRFDELAGVADRNDVSREQALIIGGFFSQEYSFEAAALFNPSVVIHHDQSGVPDGAIRFIMSLRGIGEGHVSSVTFRSGVWTPGQSIAIDPVSCYAVPPHADRIEGEEDESAIRLHFRDSEDISENVIFPMAPSQRQGVEDVRLVRFVEEKGGCEYLGTYTAFSGADIRSELLRTCDFRTFEMRPLKGSAAGGKGMALFPRRIDGRYAMLGRHDNENIWYLTSDDLYTWNDARKIVTPDWPWEYVQIGNCGSPIEIDEGWLVIIHGVGMLRNYTISACLLDKQDPTRLLGRTRRPLLRPSPEERNGYVPNVVYSCGGIVHERILLLPYGVADNFATFATMPIDDLLAEM